MGYPVSDCLRKIGNVNTRFDARMDIARCEHVTRMVVSSEQEDRPTLRSAADPYCAVQELDCLELDLPVH